MSRKISMMTGPFPIPVTKTWIPICWISPTEDIFYYNASGHGGQMIIVIPEKNLVIVSSAWPYSKHEEPYMEQFMPLLNIIIDSCD
jgi:hypothetical protein